MFQTERLDQVPAEQGVVCLVGHCLQSIGENLKVGIRVTGRMGCGKCWMFLQNTLEVLYIYVSSMYQLIILCLGMRLTGSVAGADLQITTWRDF